VIGRDPATARPIGLADLPLLDSLEQSHDPLPHHMMALVRHCAQTQDPLVSCIIGTEGRTLLDAGGGKTFQQKVE